MYDYKHNLTFVDEDNMDALSRHSAVSALVDPATPTADLIALWLHGKSVHTQRYYRRAIDRFLEAVGKPLEVVTLGDVQHWTAILEASGLSAGSQGRMVAAVKSFFTFAHDRLGVLRVNPAAPVPVPKTKDLLAERILPESVVQWMIVLEPNPRNQLLLKLLYIGGLRVSELCQLKVRDLQAREAGGQVSVYGKGGKTRVIKLPDAIWTELVRLAAADLDAPIFASRKGNGHLSTVQVNRIVKAAAQRVPDLPPQLAAQISPHWLRHAHASHAMDRGAPVHLVQATLGHASVATTGKYLHARPTDSSARFLVL